MRRPQSSQRGPIRLLSLRAAAGLIAVSAVWGGPALAEFPERPITIIVAFAPGGGNDLMIRQLAPFLERALPGGAKVEVINKAGAGGEVGYAALAETPADGYTLGTINLPNVVTIPIERSARYRLDAFDPLVGLAAEPSALMVPSDSPFVTLKDLLDAASQTGGAVTIGTSGVGSRDHLGILRIEVLTGAHFIHVPFPGGDTALKAMLAGKLSAVGAGFGDARRMEKTATARTLALATPRRDPYAPGVPTFAEQGVDFVSSALRAIAAPKGLPPDVRARLVTALRSAATNPDFVEASERIGNPVDVQGPEDVARALTDATVTYTALWKLSPWLK